LAFSTRAYSEIVGAEDNVTIPPLNTKITQNTVLVTREKNDLFSNNIPLPQRISTIIRLKSAFSSQKKSLISLLAVIYICTINFYEFLLNFTVTWLILTSRYPMDIKVKKIENRVIIELDGSLDIYTSLDLKSALEEHVNAESFEVIIDMEGLNYIDSSGIGILIKALNYVQGLNGKLCVANLKPVIEKVFKVSGLTSYFEILSGEEFKARIS